MQQASNPLPVVYIAAVSPHECKMQEANCFADESVRHVQIQETGKPPTA